MNCCICVTPKLDEDYICECGKVRFDAKVLGELEPVTEGQEMIVSMGMEKR